MEATSPPAPSAPAGSAPPPALGVPRGAPHGLRTALGLGAGVLVVIAAVAGYRLYEKDRAETAAELVRIKAYLEARAQAEAAPERKRAKPPAAERVAAASATASPGPVAAGPAAGGPAQRAEKARPDPARRSKPAEARAKPPQEARAKAADVRVTPPKAEPAPAEAPVRAAERPRSVDRLWRERTARECADGFVGLICREWLRLDLCRQHDAWGRAPLCPAAEKPPPSVMSGSLG